MAFINRYTKEDSLNYFFNKEFLINGASFLFSVGQTTGLGLVTCTNLDGDLLWERLYTVDREKDPVKFNKIIQLINSNDKTPGRNFIIHASTDYNHYLLKIDGSNGGVIWTKKIDWTDVSHNLHIEASFFNNEFFIVINRKDFKVPFVGKLSENGVVLNGVNLETQTDQFIVNALDVHQQGFVIGGRIIQKDSNGIVINLSNDLDIISSSFIDPNNTIHSIQAINEGYFLVSGYLSNFERLYLSTISDNNIDAVIIENTTNCGSKVIKSKNGFYVLIYTETNGTLHFIDYKFNVIWSKELDLEKDNNFNHITFNEFTNQLTGLAYNQSIESLVFNSNHLFETCKTKVKANIPIRFEKFGIHTFGVNKILTEFKLNDWGISASNIESEIIEICKDSGFSGEIQIGNTTSFQSPNFYIHSAGSLGNDSTKGIHTRWFFKGILGEKHLPKGNYAANNHNFNKPNDFVGLYRTKYQEFVFTLHLNQKPYSVDDLNAIWLYKIEEREIYVHFHNKIKYNQVRSNIDPFSLPEDFISTYGYNILEFENKKELFFKAKVVPDNINSSSVLQTESLSVIENNLTSSKILTSRSTFNGNEILTGKIVCENGRSIRLKPTNLKIKSISFEFYNDFIKGINTLKAWSLVGDFSLTLDDNLAYTRLEPIQGAVHGKWKRFNDDAFVNINNYKNKWNEVVDEGDKNIKQVVESYISLSNNIDNPTAVESVLLNEDETIDLSNLDLLVTSSYDFHISRMLGTGYLDLDSTVYSGSYVYVAAYITFGDLEDGLGPREVHHLSMTLPTSISDERLSLPIELNNVTPGLFINNEGEISNMVSDEGYTEDGGLRYITLYSNEIEDPLVSPPFYISDEEFSLCSITQPIFAGLEYKRRLLSEPEPNEWATPELSNDTKYYNVGSNGLNNYLETRFIGIPEAGLPFYVHEHNISGEYYYCSYSINWFSRSTLGNNKLSIITQLTPKKLNPPTNISALLITKEEPLLLTSLSEKNRYIQNSNEDKALIRLTFQTNLSDEIKSYNQTDESINNADILNPTNINNPDILFPDNLEVFPEHVEINFRDQIPNNISGKILQINEHPTEDYLSIILTGNYTYISTGQSILPTVILGTESNYIGGAILIGDEQYIIQNLDSDSPTGFAIITVYKKEISDAIITNPIPNPDAVNLQAPQIVGDGFFMAIENMQNSSSWGIPNPVTPVVQVNVYNSVRREIIEFMDEGEWQRIVEKSRGIWSDSILGAEIVEVEEQVESLDDSGNIQYDSISGALITTLEHRGQYKITFNGIQLPQHPQYFSNTESVEWYGGVVRVFAQNDIVNGISTKTRKVLNVSKIVNNELGDLVIYTYDPDYESNPIQVGNNISVNFYPGYKVYLYSNGQNLTSDNIYPQGDQDVKYSIFGLKTIKNSQTPAISSPVSVPCTMFAQRVVEPQIPEMPVSDGTFATRPDFFGRSTFTFTTVFYLHKPYTILIYRATESSFLNALYKSETLTDIYSSLNNLGGNDGFYVKERWENFLDFETLQSTGIYKSIPLDGYSLPLPNNNKFIESINLFIQEHNEEMGDNVALISEPFTSLNQEIIPNELKLIDFVKQVIYNLFTPLTEMPIIYQYINNNPDYIPINKKQNIKDENGYLLSPTDEKFEMAPMMKVISDSPHTTQFTDFNLDGTSKNLYFYAVREMGNQMKLGEFSPILGPISLVNTNPPQQPEVKRITPELQNVVLGITPKVKFEVNKYQDNQFIEKFALYRTLNNADTLSLRTMNLVETFDVNDILLENGVFVFYDIFNDLDEIPYGDGLYYRITALRKITYKKPDVDQIVVDYVPSIPSKLYGTMIVDNQVPQSPILVYSSDVIDPNGVLNNVVIQWEKTVYNGNYYLYKMSSQGTWYRIFTIKTNDSSIQIPLINTSLGSSSLNTLNEDGNRIYHHFKVVTENTSGILSQKEIILTI